MANYATWIFAATGPSAVALSTTETVRRWVANAEAQGERIDVEDWPCEPGWSVGFTPSCIYAGWDGPATAGLEPFTAFANELAAELAVPVAAGWSDNGMVFAGALSSTPDQPIPIGYGLTDLESEEYSIGPRLLAFLQEHWGTDWQATAAPAILDWLQHTAPADTDTTITIDRLRDLIDDDYGDAAHGLIDTLKLIGFDFGDHS